MAKLLGKVKELATILLSFTFPFEVSNPSENDPQSLVAKQTVNPHGLSMWVLALVGRD